MNRHRKKAFDDVLALYRSEKALHQERLRRGGDSPWFSLLDDGLSHELSSIIRRAALNDARSDYDAECRAYVERAKTILGLCNDEPGAPS